MVRFLHKLLLTASAVIFMASAALAQSSGNVTSHAFAVGKGAGSTSFTSILCASAQIAVGQSAADPICKTLTGDVTLTAAGATAIGATKVTSAMLNADVFSTAHTWAGQQTFVAPILGAATATSINKVAITAPASSATLTVPDGVTLTGPASSGTVMTLGNTETVTGIKTFGSSGAVGRFKLAGTTSGSTVLDASATASGTLTLPAATDTLVAQSTVDTLTNKTLANPAVSGTLTVTSTSATSLSSGPSGATNPAFLVDASTASLAAGLKVKGAATAGTVAISAIDSGSNTNLSIDAKGSGTISIGGTSTGGITLSRALTYGGVALSNAVTGTGNMVLSAAPTLTLNNATGLPLSTGVTGNLPAANGTIVSAFSVHKNAVDQTGVASGVSTVITWPTEVYDVNNHFASNAWTPDAGKVNMKTGFLTSGTITAGSTVAIIINKNGALYKQSFWPALLNNGTAFIDVDDIANGTDAYTVLVNVNTTAGTVTVNGTAAYTFFQGHWISP